MTTQSLMQRVQKIESERLPPPGRPRYRFVTRTRDEEIAHRTQPASVPPSRPEPAPLPAPIAESIAPQASAQTVAAVDREAPAVRPAMHSPHTGRRETIADAFRRADLMKYLRG